MKKLKKRFVALIMTFTMAISFSTVAFAAESEESTNMVIAQASAEQYAIDPMSVMNPYTELSAQYTGHERTTYTLPITIYQNFRYLYFSVASSGGINVTLYKDGVQVARAIYTEKDGKALMMPVAKTGTLDDNYFEPGEYTMKVNISFDKAYSFRVYACRDKLS